MDSGEEVEFWTLQEIQQFTKSREILDNSSTQLRYLYCYMFSFPPSEQVDELKRLCLFYFQAAERRERIRDVKGSRANWFLKWFNE